MYELYLNHPITVKWILPLKAVKMKFLRIVIITAILVFITPSASWARSGWHTLKTGHFTVFYQTGFKAEAWQALATLEYYRPQVEKICGNQEFHLAVVIDDTGTLVNGFSNPIANQIHLYKFPPQGGWAGTENWWSLVGVHEYTHHLTISKTGGIPEAISKVIGNSLFFPMPNYVTPGWILEGITVYNESQLSPYQGRLNDGLFDAYLGTRVKDGRFPSILNATYETSEFNLSGIYTYGGEFVNFLAETYGQAKLTRFFEVNGANIGSLTPFPTIGIDQSAREVFGKSFPELWGEWKSYTEKRFQDYAMEGEQITHNDRIISDLKQNNEKLYYQRRYPVKTGAFSNYDFNELIERDPLTDTERVLVSTTSTFSLPLQFKDEFLYYAVIETKPGYANATMKSFGNYSLLHQFDRRTGKDRVLLGDEIRAFTVLNGGRIIYSKDRNGAFGSEIYAYSPVSGKKNPLFSSDYLVDEMVSDSGRILVAARRDWQNLNIYQLNLETGELIPLIQTPYLQNHLSLQGEKLFFTSNYQRIYTSYCYDFGTGKTYRLTELGFASNPVYYDSSGHLYFIGLNSYGYDLYRKPARFREFEFPAEPEATVPPIFDLKPDQVIQGGYLDNLKTMSPSFHAPIVSMNNQHYEFGIYLEGQDAIGDFPAYQAMFTYDTEKRQLNSTVNLMINYFAPLDASISYSNREENSLILNLSYPVIKSYSPGLSNLSLGTSLKCQDDYQGPAIDPFVNIGFRYPKTNANLYVNAPFTRLNNGTQFLGLYAGCEINQYLPGSELTLNIQSIHDPKNPDLVFPLIRGYDAKLTARRGMICSLEYSRPVLKIRNGFWKTNIFFEDITMVLFADRAISWDSDHQESWGFELHSEVKTMYVGVPLDCGARFSRNIEGNNQINLFIEIAL
jgi:hypothetical protein